MCRSSPATCTARSSTPSRRLSGPSLSVVCWIRSRGTISTVLVRMPLRWISAPGSSTVTSVRREIQNSRAGVRIPWISRAFAVSRCSRAARSSSVPSGAARWPSVAPSSSRVPTGSTLWAPFSSSSSIPATVTVTAVQSGVRHSSGRRTEKRWTRPEAMLSVRVLARPRRMRRPRSVSRETKPHPDSILPKTYFSTVNAAGARAMIIAKEKPSVQIPSPIATPSPRMLMTMPTRNPRSRTSERTSRPVGIVAIMSPSVTPS